MAVAVENRLQQGRSQTLSARVTASGRPARITVAAQRGMAWRGYPRILHLIKSVFLLTP